MLEYIYFFQYYQFIGENETAVDALRLITPVGLGRINREPNRTYREPIPKEPEPKNFGSCSVL